MILHKMMFLQLPYPLTEDFTALHSEILKYQGFVATPEIIQTFERRHIPRNLLLVLERLLHLVPEQRPSADRVKAALEGRRSAGLAGRMWAGRSKPQDASTSKLYSDVSGRSPAKWLTAA
jgi:hypothetical protein